MKNVSSAAYDLESLDIGQEWSLGDSRDDLLLDEMRSIMKDYVSLCVQNKMNETLKQEYRTRFDYLRNQLQDLMLKDYSSFEFMEKLYLQEYLIEE